MPVGRSRFGYAPDQLRCPRRFSRISARITGCGWLQPRHFHLAQRTGEDHQPLRLQHQASVRQLPGFSFPEPRSPPPQMRRRRLQGEMPDGNSNNNNLCVT